MAKEIQFQDSTGEKYYPRPSFSIGTVIITSSNVNPKIDYGGTWELIDKEFKSKYVYEQSSEYFEMNENVSTTSLFTFIRSGHSIQMRLRFTPAMSPISDATTIIGTINLANIGVTRLTQGINAGVGGSDGGNCTFLYDVNFSTGEVSVIDVFTRAGGSSINAGQCFFQFSMNFQKSYMLDSACDKFFWKRTA